MIGSLIQIKDYISEVRVLKKKEVALVRNDTPNFVETSFAKSLANVALWLDSRKSKMDEIRFFNVNLHEPSPSEAFRHAHI